MSYEPLVKLYYIPNDDTVSEQYRIVPAPLLNIIPEIYYANNTVIGYTYIINLNGYATALDLRNPSPTESNLEQTLQAIKHIKELFSINNGTLIITYNNQEIIKATGGVTTILSFSNSDNNWVNYAPYSISLEFNELFISDCDTAASIGCANIPNGIVASPALIDMQQHRIQSFKDGWSINLDNNIYINNNQYFTIEYSVEATGKNYFDGNHLIPAWEQAKNFCQNRLFKQIAKLTSTALDATYTNCLTNGQTLSSLFSEGSNGCLQNINIDNNANYGLFNETLVSSVSETAGSFSLQYQAIIKIITDTNVSNAIHTYTITKNYTDTDKKIVSYNVEGEIQGLISGGLVKQGSRLLLQNSNELFLENNNTNQISKYNQALALYSTIGSSTDLKPEFIDNELKIKNSLFFPDIPQQQSCDGIPNSTSFTLTHNYDTGTIKYTANFDGEKICSQINQQSTLVTNLSIDYPTPMIVEFIIPGRPNGPIVQMLDVNTPKIYNLSIQGISVENFCANNDINAQITEACAASFNINVPELNFNNMFLVDEKYTKASDGSYTLNRKYIEIDT